MKQMLSTVKTPEPFTPLARHDSPSATRTADVNAWLNLTTRHLVSILPQDDTSIRERTARESYTNVKRRRVFSDGFSVITRVNGPEILHEPPRG